MGIIQIPTYDILFGPSPIDWCEDNNPETNPFQWQELHNTWSNIAYILLGVCVAIHHVQQRYPTDPLFLVGCFAGVMTGVTSAIFHSTLIYVWQKTDEFFENALLLAMVYRCAYPLVSPSPKDPPAEGPTRYILYSIHSVFLFLGTFLIPVAFAEIHLIGSVLTYFYFNMQQMEYILDPVVKEKAKNYHNYSIILAVASFALWAVDQTLCSPFVKSLNLHAFAWHWGTALALWCGCISQMSCYESHWKQNKKYAAN